MKRSKKDANPALANKPFKDFLEHVADTLAGESIEVYVDVFTEIAKCIPYAGPAIASVTTFGVKMAYKYYRASHSNHNQHPLGTLSTASNADVQTASEFAMTMECVRQICKDDPDMERRLVASVLHRSAPHVGNRIPSETLSPQARQASQRLLQLQQNTQGDDKSIVLVGSSHHETQEKEDAHQTQTKMAKPPSSSLIVMPDARDVKRFGNNVQ